MSSLTRIEQSIKVDRDIFNRDILWDKFYIPLDKLKIILSISSHPQLSNVVKGQIYGSATVSEAYDIKSLLKEYIEGSDNYLKFINTGTIDKYRSFWKTKKTQYIKGSFVRPVIEKADLQQLSLRRYKQSISPKLIIAGMSLVPEVFYDSGDYLAGKSTSIILSSEKELKFLAAVLNSKLIGSGSELISIRLKCRADILL